MQIGTISPENFDQTLRQFAQRRMSGTLTLEVPDLPLEVQFSNGRVVDALLKGSTSVAAQRELLQRAGVIDEHAPLVAANTHQELVSALRVAGLDINPDLYRQFARKRVLDLLHQLDLPVPVRFTFQNHSVDIDELSVQIPVAQLLLDRQAIASERERFARELPIGSVVRCEDPALEEQLSDEERLVCLYAQRSMSLAELEQVVPLSVFHLHESLVSLKERGVLSVGTEVAPQETSTPPETEVAEPQPEPSAMPEPPPAAPRRAPSVPRAPDLRHVVAALLIVGLIAVAVLRWPEYLAGFSLQ